MPDAAACGHLATRAGQKVSDGDGGARFDVSAAEHRLVTGKFIAACANGDLSGLLKVLAPNWSDVDYGPAAARPYMVATSAERAARHLLYFWGAGCDAGLPPGPRPADGA